MDHELASYHPKKCFISRRCPASIPHGDLKQRLTTSVLSFDIGAVFQPKLTGEGVIVGGGAVSPQLPLGRKEI